MAARLFGVIAAAAMALGAAAPALAQDHRRDDGRRSEERHDDSWRDRDMHRFRERDLGRWQHGRWFRGPHDGRPGWWWIVGDTWYFYPRPIYPYPDPYVAPAATPTANVRYYCAPSQAYYRYVPSCPVAWQAVPVQ